MSEQTIEGTQRTENRNGFKGKWRDDVGESLNWTNTMCVYAFWRAYSPSTFLTISLWCLIQETETTLSILP
jgi:hypothetical protein